jgi:DNA primase
MSKNVYDLAQEDTSLKKVSYKEYAGPCPRCFGTDRFHVQPGRKDNGAWFCRSCWPAEQKGWGDGIEYLRQMRGMSFTAAKSYLQGEVDSLLEIVEWKQSHPLLPGNEQLQERYQEYIRAAQALLWTSEGKPCLDYLLSRGLSEDTIRASKLGCIGSETLRKNYLAKDIEGETLFVVIPWYADNILWRVQLRDIASKQYRNFPKSGEGLYLGDCLKRPLPTFLVEDEFSAITIAQEAGDLVNVVATGSSSRGRTTKWESRLSLASGVLVAFDADKDGDKGSKAWLSLLNEATLAKRWRPVAKDANDMLQQGYDVRTWIQSGLDYLKGEPETIEPDPLNFCSSPGCSSEVFMFVEDGSEYGAPYCEAHYQALQQPAQPAERTSKEQFTAIAEQLAGVFPGECEIRIDRIGTYTLQDQVRAIEEQQRAQERDMWQAKYKVKAS